MATQPAEQGLAVGEEAVADEQGARRCRCSTGWPAPGHGGEVGDVEDALAVQLLGYGAAPARP